MTISALNFDVIVIGGGLCGCILASRLHEKHPTFNIALIENGPDEHKNLAAAGPITNLKDNPKAYQYNTVPQKHSNNRQILNLGGNLLSGGTAVNYCGWTRGHKADYDTWAKKVGDNRWSYDSLLPYFKKTENYHDKINQDQHGYQGPIHTNKARQFPLQKQVREAFESIGLKYNSDINSGDPNGICDMVVNWYQGQRQPVGLVYSLAGVHVMTNTQVEKIILEKIDDQLRATGVQLTDESKLIASKEVIVSCGTYRTPQVLMLSGIGPSQELQKLGIQQKVDLPVGQNMHDHSAIILEFKLKHPELGLAIGSQKFDSQPQYFTGIPSDTIISFMIPNEEKEAAAKADGIKVDIGNRSDVELIVQYTAAGGGVKGQSKSPIDGSIFNIGVMCLDPTSRGAITLKSTNPKDYPIIDPNYIATEHDRAILRSGMRTVYKAMESQIAQDFVVSEYPPEGQPQLDSKSSNADLDNRLRNACWAWYHPGGTAAMGSVVDTKCRVKGVQNLRVVDASILTNPITAHYMAPLYGISESASDMIAQDL